MNKKLMIVMAIVGMSALYVRFQVVGMESGGLEERREKMRKAAEGRRDRATGAGEAERAAAASARLGDVEQDTEGFYGFLRPKNAADKEAQNKALELNMRHDNFPQEMRENVSSKLQLPPKVMAFLCHKVCVPNRLWTLRYNYPVHSVAFSSDGTKLAIPDGAKVGIWNMENGQRLQTLQCGESIDSVAFSPDSPKLLATGSLLRGRAGIWDVETGQRLQRLPHIGSVVSIAFSSDGKLLATGSADNTVGIWDVVSGQRVQTLQHSNVVRSVAFSSHEKLLATGCVDGTVDIWNGENGQRLQTLQRGARVRSVAFSPDGKELATGSDDKIAIIWNVGSGQRLQTLRCGEPVASVAFSPDGTKLVTASGHNFWARGNNMVNIWDAASGKRLQTLQYDEYVSSVAFSPNGKLLATTSNMTNNSNVSLWNVECLQTLEGSTITTIAQYKLMEAFEETFANEPNGTVRIIGKINATPEQWATFETLPTEVQKALRPLIRNEEDQKKVEEYWRSKREAAAAAVSSGKEEVLPTGMNEMD